MIGENPKSKKKMKELAFGKGILIFDEIFQNLIKLLELCSEAGRTQTEEMQAIYKYTTEACKEYIILMTIDIQQVKTFMDELYFKDFV